MCSRAVPIRRRHEVNRKLASFCWVTTQLELFKGHNSKAHFRATWLRDFKESQQPRYNTCGYLAKTKDRYHFVVTAITQKGNHSRNKLSKVGTRQIGSGQELKHQFYSTKWRYCVKRIKFARCGRYYTVAKAGRPNEQRCSENSAGNVNSKGLTYVWGQQGR